MWATGHNRDIRRVAHGSAPTREAAMAEHDFRALQSEETSHVLQHIDLADPQSRRRVR
jgi:hypothetical protein